MTEAIRTTPGTGILDINRILKRLPHRYPFVLIDRVIEHVQGQSAVCIKNVTINEPFFQGHFPGNPIMPGVLIVEAICQAAAVVAMDQGDVDRGVEASVLFMSIDGAKFRRPVIPGDQLHIAVNKERKHGKIWRFSGAATVDGVRVAEATITAMVIMPPADQAPKSQ
ncbi:MAG: 3-hydroxyacyl-ACP dehydratase FabZ [Alphaproteobacteria bacterium]|nr:3-hydroxyacyl-ACP dehydratase FabZ [Alphaproteobacteria bacterium]